MSLQQTPRKREWAALSQATVRVEGATGVVIQPQEARCVLTAFHVIKDQHSPMVKWPGGMERVYVLKTDPTCDLALLDCPGGLKVDPIRLLDSGEDVHPGDEILVAGFPTGWSGIHPVLANGVVAGVDTETWVNADGTWGNSGGPVVYWNMQEWRLVAVILGRGGAVEKALEQTIRQTQNAVLQLNQIARFMPGGEISGINIPAFARFVASNLQATSEFISTHFRSGYVRVATIDNISAFLL
jgi:hypothetical protein